MKRILILVFGLAGLVVQAQETTERIEAFKKQISRTPFMVWEWSDEDSVRAYQDTTDGIFKMFYKDFYDEEFSEFFAFYYDAELVYDGSITRQMIRDWNSMELDSMYYHDILDEPNAYDSDSLAADVRKLYGVKWNEPYYASGGAITLEQATLELDTIDGDLYFSMTYIRMLEDSTNMNSNALYDKLEMDESEMFGVLASYDFSGQWLGRTFNVTYDLATLEPLSSYSIDSMLIVEFNPIEGGGRQVKPVKVFNDGYSGSPWETVMLPNDDSAMIVYASFQEPAWADTANLIWVDQDTLRYIIHVKPPAIEAMGEELPEGQGFAWYWDFSRIKVKEEDE